MAPVRGIFNASGVSCHLSTALLVLCHALKPISDVLIRLSQTDQADYYFRHLGLLFQKLGDDEDDEPVDPTSAYDIIETKVGVNSSDLGDATSTLAKLLQSIREAPPASSVYLQPILNLTVDGGQIHSELTGYQLDELYPNSVNMRLKTLDSRPMPVPFSLPAKHSTLTQCLEAKLSPQDLRSYTWSGAFTETVVSRDDVDTCNLKGRGWTTTRRIVVEKIPSVWILHLERFEYHDGRLEPLYHTVEIPEKLELGRSSICTSKDFVLAGGILHVTDTEDIDDPDNEGGHVVAVLRGAGDEWNLIDDEKVVKICSKTALELFAGSKSQKALKGSFVCGVLLVYQNNASLEATTSTLTAIMQQLDKHLINWSDPNSLIGRRLRILWSKGKLYPGRVIGYDSESGRHSVEYDDGDTKDYVLMRKTIEWEV